MSETTAARTNLTSKRFKVLEQSVAGRGQFRIAYHAEYIGGERNQQEAVAKIFRPQYQDLEDEYYENDFKIADRAIQYALDWNRMCEYGKDILMTKGDVSRSANTGQWYLVEPLIRQFQKFTSNNGWIADEDDIGWSVLAMEAFSHYTYHKSGGFLIVCDLQGRYRYNRFSRDKCRFELTDPAICSRNRSYGITDMGEKGIESFFANHVCNKFCGSDEDWARPRYAREWFTANSSTSMLSASSSNLLNTLNTARFTVDLDVIEE